MVQEVACLNPELQFAGLGYREVLEYSQIGVKESRSVDGGQESWAVSPDGVWSRETAGVDPLMRTQVRGGIAGHNRIQLYSVGAQDRRIGNGDTPRSSGVDEVLGPRKNCVVKIHVEVPVGADAGEICSTLNLCAARKLPAVQKPCSDLVVTDRAGQVHRVSSAEDVAAITLLWPVVIPQIEWIEV